MSENHSNNEKNRDVSFKEGNFYSVFTVVLGGLAGLLISLPILFNTLEQGGGPRAILPIIFTLIGLRVGYLRRNNRLFFYVSFFTVLVLITMIGFSLASPPQ